MLYHPRHEYGRCPRLSHILKNETLISQGRESREFFMYHGMRICIPRVVSESKIPIVLSQRFGVKAGMKKCNNCTQLFLSSYSIQF